jgi:hypothetical protein
MTTSKIYTLKGSIEDIDIQHHGLPIFRKTTKSVVEIEIVKRLMENPHTNIVNIYAVTSNCIDMELLDTNICNFSKDAIKAIMASVKQHLQALGIIYIDWKYDNVGVGSDGELKLFDFDVSGIIDVATNIWIMEPAHYYAYNDAVKNGMKTAKEIDDYAFKTEIV